MAVLRCGSHLQRNTEGCGSTEQGALRTLPQAVRLYLLGSDTPRVYSLKKLHVVELHFLHCLLLGLCEEEEGHLEAMRSLQLGKEAEEHQGLGTSKTRGAL